MKILPITFIFIILALLVGAPSNSSAATSKARLCLNNQILQRDVANLRNNSITQSYYLTNFLKKMGVKNPGAPMPPQYPATRGAIVVMSGAAAANSANAQRQRREADAAEEKAEQAKRSRNIAGIMNARDRYKRIISQTTLLLKQTKAFKQKYCR